MQLHVVDIQIPEIIAAIVPIVEIMTVRNLRGAIVQIIIAQRLNGVIHRVLIAIVVAHPHPYLSAAIVRPAVQLHLNVIETMDVLEVINATM